MTTTVNINTDKINVDKETLEIVLNTIIEDYTEFDIELMKKYAETRNLDDSRFVNI